MNKMWLSKSYVSYGREVTSTEAATSDDISHWTPEFPVRLTIEPVSEANATLDFARPTFGHGARPHLAFVQSRNHTASASEFDQRLERHRGRGAGLVL